MVKGVGFGTRLIWILPPFSLLDTLKFLNFSL